MKEKKGFGITFVSVIVFIAIIILYNFILSKKSLELALIGIIITGLFLLINIFYILKNISSFSKSKRLMNKESVENIDKSPLEIYLISTIWNHKKMIIGKEQILSTLLYEIQDRKVLYENGTLQMDSNLVLSQLSICERYLIEVVFLDSVAYQQSQELKEEKIKKMIKEKIRISILDAEENISANLVSRSQVSSLIENLKEQYFKEIDSTISAPLTLLSSLLVILNLIETAVSLNNPTMETFYIPLALTVLLVISITNKNRERVSLKTEKSNEISRVINYYSNLRHSKRTDSNKIYRVCLGICSKEEREEIKKTFRVE